MRFIVPMIPVAQMRMRITTIGRHARAYKAGKQIKAENSLSAWLWAQQFPKIESGAILLGVKAFLPIPTSYSKKRTAACLSGLERPAKKPDLDNLIKHFKDCANQILWTDDAQIVGYMPGTGKFYDDGHGARWEIEIIGPD